MSVYAPGFSSDDRVWLTRFVAVLSEKLPDVAASEARRTAAMVHPLAGLLTAEEAVAIYLLDQVA